MSESWPTKLQRISDAARKLQRPASSAPSNQEEISTKRLPSPPSNIVTLLSYKVYEDRASFLNRVFNRPRPTRRTVRERPDNPTRLRTKLVPEREPRDAANQGFASA